MQTVKRVETLESIASFYETDTATLQSHNDKRLGPHPNKATVTFGMTLLVPHPHPNPHPASPCVPDKWGNLWSCYKVPAHNATIKNDLRVVHNITHRNCQSVSRQASNDWCEKNWYSSLLSLSFSLSLSPSLSLRLSLSLSVSLSLPLSLSLSSSSSASSCLL